MGWGFAMGIAILSMGTAQVPADRPASRLVPPRPAAYGMFARASYLANDPARPSVLLIHGINSTSDAFRHVIAKLEAEGYGVIVYEYPYDHDMEESVKTFADHWRRFRNAAREQRPWTILTHSMGALLARSYVEGDHYAHDVDHLILIGPTNHGAAVAKIQPLLQIAGGVQNAGEVGGFHDGLGEASEDLAPGSRFLRTLNAKPRREGVAYHILAGDAGFVTRAGRAKIEATSRAMGVLGTLANLATSALDEVTDGTGDGCVAVASTRLDGVDDHEVIAANHVALIRGPLLFPEPGPIACWPFVVKRLPRDVR